MRLSFAHGAMGAALMLAAACTPATTETETATTEQALAIAADDPSLAWGPCPDLFPGECNIAVLHGDPAQSNADVFFRVGPHYQIAAHWHSSAERMILVSGELQVKYQGQAAATLSPGDYAYGPVGLPHSATCLSDTACTLFIAFEEPVDAHAFGGSLD